MASPVGDKALAIAQPTEFRDEWIERSPGVAYPEELIASGNGERLTHHLRLETIDAHGSTAKVGSAQSLQDVMQR